MSKDYNDLLHSPIDELDLSSGCKSELQYLGFNNLNEVVSKGWQGLREMKGFSYSWFNELIRFLDTHQLTYVLEPR